MLETLLVTVFLIVCVLLVIVVLLQRGRGGGMGGILGGGGQTAFGTRTGDVFTWVTIVLVAFFLLLATGTTCILRPERATLRPPRFVPPGGAIDKPIPVTIRSDSAKAKIHYTVDGSAPTRASLQYDAPIRVEPGTVLKARAFLQSWNDSPVATATYMPPSEPPAPPPDTRPARRPATRPTTRPATTAPAGGA